jgi:hypothetical protein
MQPFGYERPTPHLILTDNIHSDTQAEPRKLSSLTLYIDLWQEGKPAPGQNPPVISPPVVIFRRIDVRAEIRTQNPVLSNTRLIKMVPLSHLRRRFMQMSKCRFVTNLSLCSRNFLEWAVLIKTRINKRIFSQHVFRVDFLLEIKLIWCYNNPVMGSI